MAEITITFAETGQAPASFIIPAEAAALIDRFVAEVTQPGPDGPVPIYAGKAELFLRHNIETLLKPIGCGKYGIANGAVIAAPTLVCGENFRGQKAHSDTVS